MNTSLRISSLLALRFPICNIYGAERMDGLAGRKEFLSKCADTDWRLAIGMIDEVMIPCL